VEEIMSNARGKKIRPEDNFEDCPPRADAMIHSLRAFGYDLGMAIADLIDNSIYASARNICIDYAWDDGKPWIRIMDDGSGMTEERLIEAMRLGSQSPLEQREKTDLGRFGLGLKTASFSQCKYVTVYSKNGNGETAIRFWDLDHVTEQKQWQLGKIPSSETMQLLEPGDGLKRGTIVLWQKLDRIITRPEDGYSGQTAEDAFLQSFLQVKLYLEMVFHQFMESRTGKINIKIGAAYCKPWDPYLRKNDFTQELSSEKYADSKVSVIPYILPHVSKRSEEEHLRGAGLKGWNAQQGFYLYRNRRMILSGGYLDFDIKAEEHCKLARIKIDITNDMDHEWSIDVRKAVAIPPVYLRAELLRIAKAARQKAMEVYRSRTGGARRRGSTESADDIWLRRMAGEKITYRLNRDSRVLKRIIDEIRPAKSWVRKLFHVIESTVPHRLIILDGLQNEDCQVGIPDDANKPPKELLDLCIELYRELRIAGRSHDEAADIICAMDAFSVHPLYRACLDDLAQQEVRV
jgi:hypothetical protein